MSELTEFKAKNIIKGWCEHETQEYIGQPIMEDIDINSDNSFDAYLDFGDHGGIHIRVNDINHRTDFSDDFDINDFNVQVDLNDDNWEDCNWWDTSIKFFWMALR